MAWLKGLTSFGFAVAVGLLSIFSVATVEDAHAAKGTCYETFWPSGDRVVEIDACERGGGSTSGYTVLKNNTDKTLNVCWKLHFGDGSTEGGCNSSLDPRDERSASCYACNRQHRGGVVEVEWTRLKLAR